MAQLDQKIETISEECLIVRARMISRTLSAIYDTALRPLGVKASQLNILVVTGKLGVATPGEVGCILHLEASTVSRNVDRMRKQGWLDDEADPDGRATPFRLSASGRRLVASAWPAWQRAQEEAREVLGKTGADDLSRIADRMWRSEA